MKDIYFIFRREFYLVFRDHAVLTFFIFLCLGYPLIYTFIYSNEVVRQVPVAVIDQIGMSSQPSRLGFQHIGYRDT